jgi:predicted lipoprotein
MAVVAAWLAIARPWTIRPIADEPRGPFDANAYVETIWESRVLPAIRSQAVSLSGFENAPGARATAVSFDGVVTGVNTDSRVGTASIDVAPPDGRVDAVVLIGPVVRGTALRDALDFIRFTDFTNQIQFAAVANALNDRVLATALQGIAPEALAGRSVQVLGVAWTDPSAGEAPFVVPVEIAIGEGP